MGKKATTGFNDLATTHPDLAREWDLERNAPLTPQQILSGSDLRVYWLCSEGHSYTSVVSNRKKGYNCPYCSGQKVLQGFNDLATTHPDLAREWDLERNAPLTPEEVSPGSGRKVYWLCPEGHSFQSIIASRTSGRNCPYCSGRKAVVGHKDLATTHPDLAREWDLERNAPLTPEEVSVGSNKKVFWLCPKGHSYQTQPYARGKGANCPYCSGKGVLQGFNDLATTHPDLAREWDLERNAPLTPEEVSVGSNKKVFWLCPKGHSYCSAITSRRVGSSCVYCAGKEVLQGFNDLATTHPDLAREWDLERNAPLTPEEVSVGSNKKVFWLCSEGHSYTSFIYSRVSGRNCPVCAGKEVLQGFNDLATTHPDLAREWDLERNAPLTPQTVSAGRATKIYWLCPEGHSFQSSIASRSWGRGCPKCAKYGYDATQPGMFYFIRSQTLSARKIGITNHTRKYDRLSAYGQDWATVWTYESEDGQVIRDLETTLLRWLRKELQLPVYLGKEEMGRAGGQSETFTMDGPNDNEVIMKIEGVLSKLEADKEHWRKK